MLVICSTLPDGVTSSTISSVAYLRLTILAPGTMPAPVLLLICSLALRSNERRPVCGLYVLATWVRRERRLAYTAALRSLLAVSYTILLKINKTSARIKVYQSVSRKRALRSSCGMDCQPSLRIALTSVVAHKRKRSMIITGMRKFKLKLGLFLNRMSCTMPTTITRMLSVL